MVLVAGGTGGLGRSVALAFLSEGATVVVTYRNGQGFVALKNAVGPHASMLEGSQTDVTDESAVRTLLESITAKHGRVDILVNTIGAYAGGIKLWELDPKTFERMLDLNLRSGFVLARLAVPAMLKQGSGVLINIAAKAAFDHAAGAAAYATSKASGGCDDGLSGRGS